MAFQVLCFGRAWSTSRFWTGCNERAASLACDVVVYEALRPVFVAAGLVHVVGLSDIICRFAGAQLVSLQIKALLVLGVLLLHLLRQCVFDEYEFLVVPTGFACSKPSSRCALDVGRLPLLISTFRSSCRCCAFWPCLRQRSLTLRGFSRRTLAPSLRTRRCGFCQFSAIFHDFSILDR